MDVASVNCILLRSEERTNQKARLGEVELSSQGGTGYDLVSYVD